MLSVHVSRGCATPTGSRTWGGDVQGDGADGGHEHTRGPYGPEGRGELHNVRAKSAVERMVVERGSAQSQAPGLVQLRRRAAWFEMVDVGLKRVTESGKTGAGEGNVQRRSRELFYGCTKVESVERVERVWSLGEGEGCGREGWFVEISGVRTARHQRMRSHSQGCHPGWSTGERRRQGSSQPSASRHCARALGAGQFGGWGQIVHLPLLLSINVQCAVASRVLHTHCRPGMSW